MTVNYPFLLHDKAPGCFYLAVFGGVGKGTAGDQWAKRERERDTYTHISKVILTSQTDSSDSRDQDAIKLNQRSA